MGLGRFGNGCLCRLRGDGAAVRVQDSACARAVLGSTSFAHVDPSSSRGSSDKSVSAREFLMLLQDCGLLDGSLTVRDGMKVSDDAVYDVECVHAAGAMSWCLGRGGCVRGSFALSLECVCRCSYRRKARKNLTTWMCHRRMR